ncbi:hypothetical protein [Paenibacillus macquariensis]|uniref:Uncharacterized protein n=1 Tax=Paenibacillus macquariensis TaxID=948756 RepID=A0ABY1JXB3_9BACL|nr:hypothetical protein [Paenibacillus macquariensis]MEC0089361.1 hypothetical protein [Paenibacillus macquariensis]OAB33243.1 hypothetical protein PMSM_14610 [Paenibacillus macquariensis subsp. macquariensis]SIQ93033.1 hypothetical protein SAMN05421578_10598 [Paenibacillus macquariensis]
MTEIQERSVVLSNGSELLWNDEERILFVRYGEKGMPILTCPEAEIDIVLDTLEKAQSEVERLTAENTEKDALIKELEHQRDYFREDRNYHQLRATKLSGKGDNPNEQ